MFAQGFLSNILKGQPQVNGHAVGRFLPCLTKSQIWKKLYLFKQIL
jgi:hypothetical protein